MNDIKSNSERYNSQNISDRVKKAYSAIKQSKVVKVVTVAAVAVAGLFAIGGYFTQTDHPFLLQIDHPKQTTI